MRSVSFYLLRLGPHPQALRADARPASGRLLLSSNRAGGAVFAWGWGPTRAGGGGAPPATKKC